MSRPEHLTCPNTPEGIRQINAEQERYDSDPRAYEAQAEAQAQYEAEMQQKEYEAEQAFHEQQHEQI